MLNNLSKSGFNLIRSNGRLLSFNSVRSLADQSGSKSSNENRPSKQTTAKSTASQQQQKPKNEDTIKVAKPAKTETLAKPGKPSEKYEVPEYFGYNEYSYNDLIKDMQPKRNPQPRAK